MCKTDFNKPSSTSNDILFFSFNKFGEIVIFFTFTYNDIKLPLYLDFFLLLTFQQWTFIFNNQWQASRKDTNLC